MGYAVAYPFGIIGILVTILVVRFLSRTDIEAEAAAFRKARRAGEAALPSIDVEVTNPNLDGVAPRRGAGAVRPGGGREPDPQGRRERGRCRRATSIVNTGDVLHIVGSAKGLQAMKLVLGHEVDQPVTTKGTKLTWVAAGGDRATRRWA